MFEDALADRYVNALVSEITKWNMVDNPTAVDTIYFGGGTPSLLTPAQIERILMSVHDRFDVVDGAEVTLEINPASTISTPPPRSLRLSGENLLTDANRRDAENAEEAQRKANPEDSPELSSQKLQDFRSLGINRASFGAQTFDDRELKQLGRTHSAADIPATFLQLREAGFANISFDLIAGLPSQTLPGWQQNLDCALALRPDHLSLYLLDVHEGTPLADQIRSGMRPQPDDDLAGEMYQLMIEKVCAAGYDHYEISNFSLPGFASRHNTKYWAGAPYYGFGCSAHSYDSGRRRWANERDTAKYVQLIECEESPVVERTELNEEDARSESIFLGLRLMRGLDLEEYRMRFGSDLRDEYSAELAQLSDAGLIEIDKVLIRLTKRGALLSNEVFAALA
jgi:oxygen-independent coproporphyrinogen-3 oxidase